MLCWSWSVCLVDFVCRLLGVCDGGGHRFELRIGVGGQYVCMCVFGGEEEGGEEGIGMKRERCGEFETQKGTLHELYTCSC